MARGRLLLLSFLSFFARLCLFSHSHFDEKLSDDGGCCLIFFCSLSSWTWLPIVVFYLCRMNEHRFVLPLPILWIVAKMINTESDFNSLIAFVEENFNRFDAPSFSILFFLSFEIWFWSLRHWGAASLLLCTSGATKWVTLIWNGLSWPLDAFKSIVGQKVLFTHWRTPSTSTLTKSGLV